MDTPALTAAILDRLVTGALPRQKCRMTWFGPGTGKYCVACDRRITAPDIECECEGPEGRLIFLHRQCFQIWERLREDGEAAEPKS
jgi:hypothetical protein